MTSVVSGMDSNELLDLQRNVQRLADRDAIRELPIAYCHYVYTQNVEAVVELFARNGEISGQLISQGNDDIEPPSNISVPVVGWDALRHMYTKALRTPDYLPFTHNHFIEMVDEGRAKGHVYAEIRRIRLDYSVYFIGIYEDDYVKEDGAWKFARREFNATILDQKVTR